MSDRSTDDDVALQRARWDQRHADAGAMSVPAAVLTENRHLLPKRGRALDLACGLGANAVLLGCNGLDVSAWDLSPVAVNRVCQAARDMELTIVAEVRDVCAHPPGPETFDCIVVAHFLDRALAGDLAAALRPGGLLFYQTFSRDHVSDCGPADPRYRLATNELLSLFSTLTLRFYREEGLVGDLGRGTRDLVQFIGQKPLEPGGLQLND